MNKYPLKEIDESTKANRKIGLGVMGFADLLILTGVGYNSEKGISAAEKIMSFIQKTADEASCELSIKRGEFPNWKISDYADKGMKIRNATRTTIAPTGTISIIANTSSGIEPIFALAYSRNVMDGTRLVEVNPLFREALEARGLFSEELMDRVISAGSVAHIDEIPADIKEATSLIAAFMYGQGKNNPLGASSYSMQTFSMSIDGGKDNPLLARAREILEPFVSRMPTLI